MNTIILVVLILELTLFFMFSSSVKILGWPKARYNAQVEFFSKLGLHRNMVVAVGAIELFGAVTLWLPNYVGVIGLLVLCSLSVFVICGHIRFYSWKSSFSATAILVIAIWVFYMKCLAIWA